jgi:RNA polymerase sigma factor (sigma-70 family)
MEIPCLPPATQENTNPGPASSFPGQGPQIPDLLREFDPRIMVYLRRLLNSQPLVRLDWETHDFFQELSSRYLLHLSAKKSAPSAKSDHESALLKRLARHLFVDQLRRVRAQKRDVLRMQHLPESFPEPVKTQEPSQLDRMVRLETIDALRKKLTEDEWELLRLHSDGFGWVDIAAAMGKKPSAVRMQFNRLVAKMADSIKE